MFGSLESALRWRLIDGKGPDKWVHESGRVVLLGDACHPILVRYTVNSLLAFIAETSS